MARVRVQRKTRRRESPSVHRFAVSLETRLANVVCRDVATGVSSLDLRACGKITRRRKKNSSSVCAQPIPECAAKIHPRGLVSLSVHQTRRPRLVGAHLRRGISAPNRSRDPDSLLVSHWSRCSVPIRARAKTEPELWVSCCKRFIGIVPTRKIASINGGLLSNQNYRRSRKRVLQRCGFRLQTRQPVGNPWATTLTITMTSVSSIKKAARLRGSVPKTNYST